MRQLPPRIISDLFLLWCVYNTSWFITAIIAAVFAIFFSRYYEAIIAALFIELLYGSPPVWNFVPFPITLSMIIFYVLSSVLKKNLIFYPRDM